MKNNIFQKMLATMFAVAALLATGSASAIRVNGECGIYDQNDLEDLRNTKVSRDTLNKWFREIMSSEPWYRKHTTKCHFLQGWYGWSMKEKEQLINHLVKKGVFNAEDVEGWQDMVDAPNDLPIQW